jgi:PAS domain-containing protein
MAPDRHKNLALILTRELASNLATPIFIVDPDGTLVFYNEPAEAVLGKRYAEAGPLTIEEWGGTMFEPEDGDGKRMETADLPLAITLERHKPSHKQLRITGLDGVKRSIEVTAFPIFAKADEFVGAVAIFWEDR